VGDHQDPAGLHGTAAAPPAPPLVFTAATVPTLHELLEHGYDTGKLAGVMRGFGGEWAIERLDPGSAWIAASRNGSHLRMIATADLDSLRSRLSRDSAGVPDEAP
jgi:hypothetical protein